MAAGRFVILVKQEDGYGLLTKYDYDDASKGGKRKRMLDRVAGSVQGWAERFPQFRDRAFQVREIAIADGGNVKKRKGKVINLATELAKAGISYNVKPVKQPSQKKVPVPTKGKAEDALVCIHIIAKKNPCREGTKAWDIYACMKQGMTVSAFIAQGKSGWNMRGAITYFETRGYIEVRRKK